MSQNPTVLIIDDEEGIRFSMRGILEDEGYAVLEAASGEQGLALAAQNRPHLVFLDIWLPGMDGMTVLEKLLVQDFSLPVVMISGHGTIETAVTALRLGARDFVEKPLSLEKIVLIARNSLENAQLRLENMVLRAAVEDRQQEKTSSDDIVGISPVMRQFKSMLAQVAPTDAWVLVTGENGTGKELTARALHQGSARASQPMVAMNCAAIPEELIESELFGHEKGAFTGAESVRVGKFELAHKGTLFLDEIGDMSLKTQARILRILQEQCFERVGGNRSIHVDVRVIAATNKNLEEAIVRKEFREDLYYRLRVFPLHVPPLRQRQEDIPLLVQALSQRLSGCRNTLPLSFSAEAMEALQGWRWPGNVRELAHLLERLSILYPGETIGLADLPAEFLPKGLLAPPMSLVATNSLLNMESATPDLENLQAMSSDDFKAARSAFEHYYLQKKLVETGGNISKLAEKVGLERSYLYRKLKAGKNGEGKA